MLTISSKPTWVAHLPPWSHVRRSSSQPPEGVKQIPPTVCVQHKPLTSDEHRQTRRSCTRVKQELTLQIQWLVHQWLLPFLLADCRMRSFIRMLHLFEVWWLPAGWKRRGDADFDVSESVYLYLVEWKWFLLLKQRRSASALFQSFFFSSSFCRHMESTHASFPFLSLPFPCSIQIFNNLDQLCGTKGRHRSPKE